MKKLLFAIGILCICLTACNKEENLFESNPELNIENQDAILIDDLKVASPTSDQKKVFKEALERSWTKEETKAFYQQNGKMLWDQLHVEHESANGHESLISLPFAKDGKISAVILQEYRNGEYTYATFEADFLELSANEIIEKFNRSAGIQAYASFTKHQIMYNQGSMDLSNKAQALVDHSSVTERCFAVITYYSSELSYTEFGIVETINVWKELVYVGGCGGSIGISPNIAPSFTPPGSSVGGDSDPDNNDIDWEPGDCEPNTVPHLAEQLENLDLLFPECQNKTADQIIEDIMSQLCEEVDSEEGEYISMEMVLEKLEAYDAVNKKDFENNPQKFTQDILEAICNCEFANSAVCDLTSNCPGFVFDSVEEAMKLYNATHIFNDIAELGGNLDCDNLDDLFDDYECFYMEYNPINFFETIQTNPADILKHLGFNILATRKANCTKVNPCGSIGWDKLFLGGGPPSNWNNTLYEFPYTVNGKTFTTKMEVFIDGFPVSLSPSQYQEVVTANGTWARFEWFKENTDITAFFIMVPIEHAALFGTKSNIMLANPCQ